MNVNYTFIAVAAVFFLVSAMMTVRARKAEEPEAKKGRVSAILFMAAGTMFVLAGVMPMLRSL